MKINKLLMCIALTWASWWTHAAGIGVSSEVYAKRFNDLAMEMKVNVRMRSDNAKVNRSASRMVVTLPLDRVTKLMLGYGSDQKVLQDVTLSRPIGNGAEDLVDTMAYMMLASMSAFDGPKEKRVGSLTTDACKNALEQPGSTHKRQVDGRTIRCTIMGSALILGVE